MLSMMRAMFVTGVTWSMGMFFLTMRMTAAFRFCFHADFLSKSINFHGRCQHYRRRCRIRAPCCGEVFDCRHCHNEAMVSTPWSVLVRLSMEDYDYLGAAHV